MLKFISVGFWTLLGPSRGLFKTTLLWSLTFFDGFLGPLCCHLWPFLTVFGANFMPKKGLLLEGFGSKLCGDPEPNFEESKQDYRFVKKWGQPDTNSSRHDVSCKRRKKSLQRMEFDINILGCHCSHEHHSVLGDIVSAAVMQNVNTFETRKNGLYSISERKRAFFTISPTRKNGDNCTAKNNFKVSDEG